MRCIGSCFVWALVLLLLLLWWKSSSRWHKDDIHRGRRECDRRDRIRPSAPSAHRHLVPTRRRNWLHLKMRRRGGRPSFSQARSKYAFACIVAVIFLRWCVVADLLSIASSTSSNSICWSASWLSLLLLLLLLAFPTKFRSLFSKSRSCPTFFSRCPYTGLIFFMWSFVTLWFWCSFTHDGSHQPDREIASEGTKGNRTTE